jgi:proteasome lid subunit RPN8/RPN11
MKIVKTKTIEAKDVSEISDELLIDFKNRTKLHDNSQIPEFFVYIQDYAWNAFVSHGNNVYKALRHEAQGIFVGHYFKDQYGEFIVATSYEEGDGNSQSAYVEMSEECLAKISEKCQANGTLMLIWVHTHPGFSVFYSSTDYNCLKTNFYKSYQIGIVVDILGEKHKGFKTRGIDVVDFENYALFSDKKNLLFSPYGNNKIKIVKESDRITSELKVKNEQLEQENEKLKKKLQEKNSRGKRRKNIKDKRNRRR